MTATLGVPSLFWKRLAAEHSQQLQRHGFGEFKRHQSLRYFSWRWSRSSIAKSEQLRFLLANTPPLTWLRCARSPAALGDPLWQDSSMSGDPSAATTRLDRWCYTFAVRLLWEYASGQDQLGVLRLAEPRLGNPFPVYWRGRLISQDLANSALEVNAIMRAIHPRSIQSILEVGGGYGRTAYVLLLLCPKASYTLVDIEPALSIARWYLGQLFPACRVRFLTPDQALDLGDGAFSLGLSISSLQDMTLEQVQNYLLLFDRVVSNGVVYLKQWREWRNPDDGVTMRFAEYPIPRRWHVIFNERAPVQIGFQHAAWSADHASTLMPRYE